MASNSEKMKARQTLSASISAEALLNHQEHVSRRPVQFTITDILPQKNGIKADASLPTSPSTLGPLSLPRPGKNATFFLTSGTEQSPPVAPKSIKKEVRPPVQITRSLESYAERLEQPENTELFTYASALCHRVTGRYLPRALIQSDPEAQQRELERVQRDPEILRAIDSVRVLSAQFKDVAQNTMGHRKDLGLTLFRIEESYLKLFEKLLELSLRLYWDYEQRTEAQRREDRATAERWREKYERKSVECVKINKKLAAREIIHRTREIELRDYQGQTKEIEKELGSQRELEAQILQLQDAAALQRVLGRKLQDDYALLTKTHENVLEYQKQLREELQAQHKQLVNDLRKQTFGQLTGAKKRTKKAARRFERIEQQWELPSHTVLFLSNLPKSVVAFPFYTLEQVIEKIEAIYDDKFVSDKADEADGVAREELSRFICEYFLKTHGLRQSAEIGLYRFLVSVKSTYQRNSHVRLFARMSHLLKAQDEDPETDDPGATLTTKVAGKKKDTSSSSQTTDSGGDSNLKTKKRSGYVDRSFLRVFLEARHYMLRAPPRVPPKGKKIRQLENHKPLVEEHVVQVEPTKKWVPLDHAISVLRWYINCLPEDSISTYCRQVEYNTAIYDGRTIAEVAGNRLAVRAEMRRAMLANENPDSAPSQTHNPESRQRPLPPRIVADVHKVLKLLMDALEQRREGIKKDLTALFDTGDMNHDCVLNLDEFSAIIRSRKPHFSDRRILRMFREALMGGVDQSFALSMEAFVVVCNDHGLVSLLPDDRMVDPFASPEAVLNTSRQTKRAKSAKQNDGELSQAANTATDVSSSLLAEIPEDINWNDGVLLPSARAEEVEDENLVSEHPEENFGM